VVTGTDGLRHLPARRGRTALLASLTSVHSTPRQSSAPTAAADLAAGLQRLMVVQARRAQVVVVSDFLAEDEWADQLGALARRHDVVAVHVTDPRELELPAVGILAVVDAETGQQRYVQTSSKRLRDRYAAAAAGRTADITRRIECTGARHLRLSTDRDWLTDVVVFVTRQGRRRNRVSFDAISRFGTAVAR
jgi:uncharacterized protein (DUF58 family)